MWPCAVDQGGHEPGVSLGLISEQAAPTVYRAWGLILLWGPGNPIALALAVPDADSQEDPARLGKKSLPIPMASLFLGHSQH